MRIRYPAAVLLTTILTGPGRAQISPPAPAKSKPIKSGELTLPPFSVWQLRAGATAETQVTATQLNPGGYWILLYVDLHAPVTAKILTELAALATPPATPAGAPSSLDPSKLVIVAAGASGAALSAEALQYPALSASAWTHDEGGAAATRLAIRGTPHLFGMHADLQRWQFAGELKDSELKPILLTWAGMNRLPANALTRKKLTRPQILPVQPGPDASPQGAPR